jgi:hypothetical protein
MATLATANPLGEVYAVGCEHMFVTSQGSEYGRLQRALRSRNLLLAEAAAADCEHVDLADALALCLLIAGSDAPRYRRAATRWHGRLCIEAGLSMDDAELALAALRLLPHPDWARAGARALADVCAAYGLRRCGKVLEDHRAALSE